MDLHSTPSEQRQAQGASGRQMSGVEWSADSAAMQFVVPQSSAASIASSWEHVADSARLLHPDQAGSAPTAGPKRLLRSLSKLKEVQPLLAL